MCKNTYACTHADTYTAEHTWPHRDNCKGWKTNMQLGLKYFSGHSSFHHLKIQKLWHDDRTQKVQIFKGKTFG